MRTFAHCTCGWRRELSGFYAGKRIRCPDCLSVVDVPGESTHGLYNSPLPPHAARDGQWVPLRRPHRRPTRCRGTGLFILLMAVVISVNAHRLLQPDSRLPEKPAEAPPTAPEASPPARDSRPPAENEDEF